MPEKYSNSCRYTSRYGGGWITAAQYLAEIMCERQAQRKEQGLCVKFWNSQPWKKQYMLQLLTANKLLKKYSEREIIAAVNSQFGSKIFSLTAKPLLLPLLKQIKKQTVDITNIPQLKTEEIPRQPFSAKKSRLRDLDD